MPEIFGFDAFSPKEIAERVQTIGVAKARLPLLSMVMLGILAGAFIGLGALYFTLVTSDADLGFAARHVLGGSRLLARPDPGCGGGRGTVHWQ